jgi:hypothetical protein
MALIDLQNVLSDGQDLAQSAGTYVSTNTLDLTGGAGGAAQGAAIGVMPAHFGTAITDKGRGRPVHLVVRITETFTSAGAATVKAQLISSASANLGTPTVLGSSEAIALATLVKGYQFRVAGVLPKGIAQRYLGVQYVIGTATTTAGKCDAYLSFDPADDNYTAI